MSETKEKDRVWVIGHRNPDTDSVCAAISYAYLKNQLDDSTEYIAKKAGPLNGETRYVLRRFSCPEPGTVLDVKTQIRDLKFRHTPGISSHYSLKKAWALMKEQDVVTLPIVDTDNRLEGIIVNGDIAYSYMDVYDNRVLGRARTQYKNIVETLDGNLLTGNIHGYFVTGKVVVASGNREAIRNEIEADDLVILGNVKERQEIALEKKPSCMIVTGVKTVSPDIVEEAAAIDCVLIATEYDSFTVARLINQSMPIKYFMTKKGLETFELDDTVDDVRERMAKIRHRDFPVLDGDGHYMGMFSRRNLLNMERKKLILVDHNEKSQAVEGIDEADILEIIDHHRIGSLETIQPIYFRNQPLGCSSTIIYRMFLENNVEIPGQIAGLMLSAIISDTLMFRSPTCTEFDVEAGHALAAIAGVEIEDLANGIFEAGSDFAGKSDEEIFYQDFKVFHDGDISFGVAQVSAVSTQELSKVGDRLQGYLRNVLADQNLSMVFMLLTNIIKQGSLVIFDGKEADAVLTTAFGTECLKENPARADLPGVVSRKKQFIPNLCEALDRRNE